MMDRRSEPYVRGQAWYITRSSRSLSAADLHPASTA
jgi:hypothetical protein